MRMIAALDEPTAGRVRVNGKDYRAASAPMAELGILLEASAVHTGRSARNHLLALAQTNGVSRRRPEGVLWIRNLLKGLAAEGRTVFVSSHLMSEMALTATGWSSSAGDG